MISHVGEFAALATAVFWTITALAFESASLKIGSLQVNLARLLIAFLLLSVFLFFYRGSLFPSDANSFQWGWLLVSGIVGFVIGDLLLFESYTLIGSRMAMLIMTLVPPISAFFGWLLMGELLSPLNIVGMLLTLSGIGLAIFSRKSKKGASVFSYSVKGLLFALGGATGQAIGLVLSKYGMGDYDPFAATQIRVIAGVAGFGLIFSLTGRWKKFFIALKNTKAMTRTSIGAFFGPFLGVSMSLLAVKYTATGIASTIMAIVPILIIPPSVFLFRQKVSVNEVIGAFLGVAGVALFFLF